MGNFTSLEENMYKVEKVEKEEDLEYKVVESATEAKITKLLSELYGETKL